MTPPAAVLSDPLAGHPVLAPGILRGVQLLEADAGTGKTWTLSGLVLRALIERELPIWPDAPSTSPLCTTGPAP